MSQSMPLPSGALARLKRPDYPAALDQFSTFELVAALLKRTAAPGDDFAALKHWASILAMELERTGERFNDRFSRQRLMNNFKFLFMIDELKASHIPGTTVVELGCGGMNPLARLLVFLMLGAKQAIGYDLDDIQDPHMASLYLARSAAWVLMDPEAMAGLGHPSRQQMISNLEALDLRRLEQGDWGGIEQSPLEFRQQSIYDIDLDGDSVDVIFSMSFLEHIPDCPKAIAVMHRIMKPGAIGIHAIDGYDHGFYNKNVHPLDFLKVETPEPMVRGCNRVRPLEFIDLFEQGGFEVLMARKHSLVELEPIQRQELAMPFRVMSDEMLKVGRIHLYVRKRP